MEYVSASSDLLDKLNHIADEQHQYITELLGRLVRLEERAAQINGSTENRSWAAIGASGNRIQESKHDDFIGEREYRAKVEEGQATLEEYRIRKLAQRRATFFEWLKEQIVGIHYADCFSRRCLHTACLLCAAFEFAEVTVMACRCKPETSTFAGAFITLWAMSSILWSVEVILRFSTATMTSSGILDGKGDLPEIRTSYITSWFFWDLVSCLPFDLFALAFDRREFNTMQCAPPFTKGVPYSWLHVLRIMKVARLGSLFQSSDPLRARSSFINSLQILSAAFFWVHTLACLWIFIAGGDADFPIEPSVETGAVYLDAMMWAFQTSVYGCKVVPLKLSTTLFTIFTVVTGIVLQLAVYGIVAMVLAFKVPLSVKFQEKVSQLSLLMQQYHVPWRTQKEVHSLYSCIVPILEMNASRDLLSVLPEFLQKSILNHVTYEVTRKIPSLSNLGLHCIECLSAISSYDICSSHHDLVGGEDIPKYIFYISRGLVSVRACNQATEEAWSYRIADGNWIADPMLLWKSASLKITATCITPCEIVSIRVSHLHILIEKYPEVLEALRNEFTRMKTTMMFRIDPQICREGDMCRESVSQSISYFTSSCDALEERRRYSEHLRHPSAVYSEIEIHD